MSLRDFLGKEKPLKIKEEVDPYLEIAKRLSENQERVLFFENVKGSDYPVVGNVCSSRDNFALSLEVPREEMLCRISDAISEPSEPAIVEEGPCQEVVEKEVDLSRLPVPTYTSGDLGPYITSGVFIAKDPEYGLNASFHRTSPISKNSLVARICQRNLYAYLERAGGELDVAICIGLDPSVLLATAIPVGIDVNELSVANSLKKLELVECKTKDLLVPADAEFVLEGRITKKRSKEGPFLDITRTYDVVRKEPVIEIDCVTRRKDPVFQALLPASREHELLMGMPREPAIYNEVSKVCCCKNVLLSHGGCSWLHGIVQIQKKKDDDGKKAIDAAMQAHPSMKHVVAVDEDVDIYDVEDVEWAIATRFQAGTDLVTKHEPGSSLDPCVCEDRMTYKLGLDATIPSDKPKDKFKKVSIGR